MQSNPATLAASRALLSRNNSSASNLSAAAAAAALRRASSQKFEEELLSQRPSSSQGIAPSSPRPGLHRRTSSMSERSFRAQAPEDHARERAASLMDVSVDNIPPEKPKRKGSFTIPISLRSNSQQKKAKGVSPGVIQPLPQQQEQQQPQSTVVATNRQSLGTSPSTERRGSQHKFKMSLRDGA